MHRRCYPTRGLVYGLRWVRDANGIESEGADIRLRRHGVLQLQLASSARPTTSSASPTPAGRRRRLSA